MTTSVKRTTPKLDALERMLKDFEKGSVSIVAEVPAAEALKVKHGLEERGRPLMQPNRAMGLAFARYAKAAVSTVLASNGVLTAQKILDAGTQGVRAHVLLRLRQGSGNDVAFRPLSPAYLAAKLRARFPRNIGIRTGDLYAALDRARWFVRRR